MKKIEIKIYKKEALRSCGDERLSRGFGRD